MTLGRDESFMVTLKFCCFRCDLLRCASRTGQIQIVEGPFFELRLHNVWLVTPCTYEYLCIHITWSPRSKIKENPCTFPDGTQVQYMGLFGPLVCPVPPCRNETQILWFRAVGYCDSSTGIYYGERYQVSSHVIFFFKQTFAKKMYSRCCWRRYKEPCSATHVCSCAVVIANTSWDRQIWAKMWRSKI